MSLCHCSIKRERLSVGASLAAALVVLPLFYILAGQPFEPKGDAP